MKKIINAEFEVIDGPQPEPFDPRRVFFILRGAILLLVAGFTVWALWGVDSAVVKPGHAQPTEPSVALRQ